MNTSSSSPLASSCRPHVLFIVGPTACGKTDFAVEAAERVRAATGERLPEIINGDSVQFFDGVEIGAAKPGPDLMARVPHHLVGHVPLGGTYTAADFRREALETIDRRSRSGVRRFFVAGGSGFYVRALDKGMYEVPEIPESVKEGVRADLEALGAHALHEELRRRDPEAAARIQPQDRYRIARALEILRASPEGQTLGRIRADFEEKQNLFINSSSPFHSSKIGLFRPRDVLRRRVEERTRRMMDGGLLDEVLRLRALGLASWAPLRSVGYREVQELVEGRLQRKDLEASIVTSTMQLAKRQMTWFKRDPDIRWFNVENGFDEPLEHVLALVAESPASLAP